MTAPPHRPTYSDELLKERIRMMSGKPLNFSNQYGMRFILNEQGEIFLNISALAEEVAGSTPAPIKKG